MSEMVCYLIERAIDGVPHWLAWRGRDHATWTAIASEADRFEWGIAASQEARRVRETLGCDCRVIEHIFFDSATEGGE